MVEGTLVNSKGSPALGHGFLFGLIQGAIQIVLGLLITNLHQPALTLPLSLVGILLAFFFYFLAGFQAAQSTGRVGTGAFAGLWTAIISALISLIGAYALATVNIDTFRQVGRAVLEDASRRLNQPMPTTADQFLLGAVTISGLGGFALSMIIGLLIGALGGLLGRGKTSRYSCIYDAAQHDIPGIPKHS
ncbi:hypothetical protein [Dictyobacter formicarum]|uniref:DUF4199 domain-containing protein n=1 Tax=Dictyobacter formicarum TaxID=2778368 RepID=A0ABQ3VKE2_9CHLR|nr:hypothetical protein [Dictyobacter formicarum]GHO85818.1 hypothetical protein KSZ_38240 [Dictyobacter formicarum]